MGGTSARIAEERHADIPLLLHPHPRRALFLGLGTGISFATARFYPDLIADGIELVPEVARSMSFFQPAPETLANPSLRIHIADARRFLLTTTNLYDVIEGDLFHPAQDGAAFLYTREHFGAINNRLQQNGLFCQWLPLFQMDLDTVRIITRTFLEVFPTGEAWLLRFNVDTPVIGLIARKSGAAILSEQVTARLRSPALREHLKHVALSDSIRLLGCFLAGSNNLRDFTDGAAINRDLYPFVLFRAPYFGARKSDDPGGRLNRLITSLGDPSPALSQMTEDLGLLNSVRQFIQARNTYLIGLAAESSGNIEQAITHYVESARLSPEFTSGYAQCITLATASAKSNPKAARAILEKLNEAQPQRPFARELLERLELTP
jgi:spermidine synthase